MRVNVVYVDYLCDHSTIYAEHMLDEVLYECLLIFHIGTLSPTRIPRCIGDAGCRIVNFPGNGVDADANATIYMGGKSFR